ncbi:unnamed protein product [Caenorhabditis angaria]|uniref:DUF4773 domain-containing protein n=1 Tax=Caenorhabditis angaria TaxID=860376 RepID=A0A9P1MZE9_9PELO|nr:unnamed protein product [Caenorhabditis angaria]
MFITVFLIVILANSVQTNWNQENFNPQQDDHSCKCVSDRCACCATKKIIFEKHTFCVIFSNRTTETDDAFDATVTIDNFNMSNLTSISNSSSLCVNHQNLVCFDFQRLNKTNGRLNGCVEARIHFSLFFLRDMNFGLGCF